MKTASDPRHLKRITTIQKLFASQFQDKPFWGCLSLIDSIISRSAPEWPVEKIDKIDLAILRSSIYEMLIDKKTPVGVIIDEAVEIAKEFGHESSPNFINGVLGTVVRNTMNTKDAILNFLANEWHCDPKDLNEEKSITEADLIKIQDALGLEIPEEENKIETLGDLLNILVPESHHDD
jgi:N utilization substance protein B